MTLVYFPNAPYDRARNVRDFTTLAQRLNVQPTGPAWALVGARRRGKSWSLAGIQDALGAGAHVQLINCQADDWKKAPGRGIVLVDEPSAAEVPCNEFLARCAAWKKRGRVVLVAMCPAEWEDFTAGDLPVGSRLHDRDRIWLDPLTPGEQDALASRAGWATQVLNDLPASWRTSPFLLELALAEAERNEASRACTAALLARAVDTARKQGYVSDVVLRGLSVAQQDGLRSARRGIDPPPRQRTVLEGVGLVAPRTTPATGGVGGPAVHGAAGPGGALESALADPVVAATLPPPLRIDHVSDVHFGRHAGNVANAVPDAGAAGLVQTAAGAAPLAESYRRHVASCSPADRPHLLVVSGDITETAATVEFTDARTWLDRMDSALAPHPALPAGTPRVVLVGGNHDVRWVPGLGGAYAAERHEALAREIGARPRPQLEVPPPSRPLARVAYDGLHVELVLLGSAELGSELIPAGSPRKSLVDAIEAVHKRLADAPTAEEQQRIRDELSRIDPGLVHHEDLARVRANPSLLPLRIAVLHHPVSPVPTGDVTLENPILLNAAETKQALAAGKTQLVLHGHLHTSFILHEEWFGPAGRGELWISSAPSLASTQSVEGHGFHRIEVLRDLDEDGPVFRVSIQPHRHHANAWSPYGERAEFAIREDGSFLAR